MSVRAYIFELARQAPLSWRRGQVVIAILIGVAQLGLLYFSQKAELFPAAWFWPLVAVFAACDVLIYFPYSLWTTQKSLIENLEEKLRPKIEIDEVILQHELYYLHGQTRVFEFSVRNAGNDDLTNCIVKIEKIEPLDGTLPSTRHLPMALRTARNDERDGGGPFHLRPGETKIIPFVKRPVAPIEDISFAYEAPEPHMGFSLRETRDLRVTVGFFGAPAPGRRMVYRLKLDDENKLAVTAE